MRILITADLHYDIRRSRAAAEQLAGRACGEGGDAVVLVGDSAGRDLHVLRECLRLFADFPGRRLMVPGNHCLWSQQGEDTLRRYEQVLPEIAAEEGFHVLDRGPVVLAGCGRGGEAVRLGLAGSIGWYDYSMADETLSVPRAFYAAKVSPGAAERLGGYDDLLAAHRDELGERQMELVVRWMDGQYIHLPMSDGEFVDLLARRLGEQLEELSAKVDRIVAFLHHLPFPQQVPQERPDRFAFAAAYMGSERFGEVLRACRKVTDVYSGHSHWRDRRRIDGINVVNIGSTYTEKHLEVLEV